MNSPVNGVEPPPVTAPQGGDVYMFVVGFICVVVILVSLTYTSYICRQQSESSQTTVSFGREDADNRHLIAFSRGLNDDVLVTFPTFLYSDDVTLMAVKGEIVKDSSCSICLSDYKPADVVRLIPECGHLFHVSCIDTWLKVHPTCPMCRNLLMVP